MNTTIALALAFCVAGIVLLSFAADAFVEGAARLATIMNVSPIVIGAVIIGFGTSAPEMLVSAVAAAGGDVDLGLGNVIGSNIANLSLVLGSAALIVPIAVAKEVLKREAIMATVAAVIFALAVYRGIEPWEGAVLLLLLISAIYWVVRSGNAPPIDEFVEEGYEPQLGTESIRTFVGLVGTVGGAWVLVRGATDLATEFGFDKGFVGVTLVAIGTSLPELVTTVAAARQGSTDLIVGNLLGSNLFNSLAVGAVIGFFGSDGVGSFLGSGDSAPLLDITFMLIVCIGAFVAMWTREVFTRLEGIVLLGVFVAFIGMAYASQAGESAAAAIAVVVPG